MDDLSSIAVSNAVAATALALLAFAVGAVYRRPALVHGLWLLVLLKLVTPPLIFLPIVWPAAAESPSPDAATIEEEPSTAAQADASVHVAVPPEGGEAEAAVEAPSIVETPPEPPQAVLPEPFEWPQLLQMIWTVGALAWFLLALERLHHFRRLLRFSRPASAALQERTRRLAHSLGLRRCPRVRLLPGRLAPMLWAVGGPPRLLVPAALLSALSDDQLETLLLHELAHLRRRDHWVRILEFLVMGLYWWHPIVWYARRELREAEEQCCDAWVVSTLPGTGRTYASALLDTLDFLSTAQNAMPPLASGLSQIADLKRRLTMIMRGNTPRSLTWPGCLAVIALGLTVLPMLPSLHGQQPSKEDASQSVEEATKALEQAQAALERQKVDLEKKRAELAVAEAKLKALRNQHTQLQRQHAIRALPQPGRVVMVGDLVEAKPTIQITIDIDADTPHINVADLQQKLKELLPQKDVRIHFAATRNIHHAVVRPVDARPVTTSVAPRASAPSLPTRAPSGGQEKRINDLEKKLESVLRELQEMKKQMKHSPGGYGTTPPSAAGNFRRNNRLRAPGDIAPAPPSAAGAVPPQPSSVEPPGPPPAVPSPPARPGGAAPEPTPAPPPATPARR